MIIIAQALQVAAVSRRVVGVGVQHTGAVVGWPLGRARVVTLGAKRRGVTAIFVVGGGLGVSLGEGASQIEQAQGKVGESRLGDEGAGKGRACRLAGVQSRGELAEFGIRIEVCTTSSSRKSAGKVRDGFVGVGLQVQETLSRESWPGSGRGQKVVLQGAEGRLILRFALNEGEEAGREQGTQDAESCGGPNGAAAYTGSGRRGVAGRACVFEVLGGCKLESGFQLLEKDLGRRPVRGIQGGHLQLDGVDVVTRKELHNEARGALVSRWHMVGAVGRVAEAGLAQRWLRGMRVEGRLGRSGWGHSGGTGVRVWFAGVKRNGWGAW